MEIKLEHIKCVRSVEYHYVITCPHCEHRTEIDSQPRACWVMCYCEQCCQLLVLGKDITSNAITDLPVHEFDSQNNTYIIVVEKIH